MDVIRPMREGMPSMPGAGVSIAEVGRKVKKK